MNVLFETECLCLYHICWCVNVMFNWFSTLNMWPKLWMHSLELLNRIAEWLIEIVYLHGTRSATCTSKHCVREILLPSWHVIHLRCSSNDLMLEVTAHSSQISVRNWISTWSKIGIYYFAKFNLSKFFSMLSNGHNNGQMCASTVLHRSPHIIYIYIPNSYRTIELTESTVVRSATNYGCSHPCKHRAYFCVRFGAMGCYVVSYDI